MVLIKAEKNAAANIIQHMQSGADCDIGLRGQPDDDTSDGSDLLTIPAHKNILSAASLRMFSWFHWNFLESRQNNILVVGVGHETLARIVNFLYTDELRINATNVYDDVLEILITADYLGVDHVSTACETFLAGIADERNWRHLWVLGQRYNRKKLTEAAFSYFAAHIARMPENSAFLKLSFDDCLQLFGAKAVAGISHARQVAAAVAWCIYPHENRVLHAEDLRRVIDANLARSFDEVEIFANVATNTNVVKIYSQRMNDGSKVFLMHSEKLYANVLLRTIFENAELADASLVPAFGDVIRVAEMKVHKNVFSQLSPVFAETLRSRAVGVRPALYVIPNVNSYTLGVIVKYVYEGHGEIADDVVHNLCVMLHVAEALQYPGLYNACNSTLFDNIDGNCVFVWRFANNHNICRLQEAIAQYCSIHLSRIQHEELFAELHSGDFCRFMSSRFILENSPNLRSKVSLQWLGQGECISDEDLASVTKIIPLQSPTLSIGTTITAIESARLRCFNPEILLDAALNTLKRVASNYPTMTEESRERRGEHWQPLNAWSNDNWLIIPSCKHHPNTNLLQYDITGRRWLHLPQLPWSRNRASACVFGNQYFVFGGEKNGDYTTDVDVYDITRNTWGQYDSLPGDGRLWSAVAAFNNKAYVINGESQSGYLNGVQELDVYKRRITPLKHMPRKRAGIASVAVPNSDNACKVFVAGGRMSDDSVASSIIAYDPETNCWGIVPCYMRNPRYDLASGLSGDDMYLVGGRNSSHNPETAVEIFNVRTSQIRPGASLPQSRYGCSAITMWNSNVVCVFGDWSAFDVRDVVCCDVREGKWHSNTVVPEMPYACGYCACSTS